MQIRNLKRLQVLIAAAALTALIVIPVGLAGARSPASTSIKVAKKQIKALTKRVASLEATLTNRIAALEPKNGPTALPPNGPAAGALTGNYPNPRIGPNAVGSSEIGSNGVGSSEVASQRSTRTSWQRSIGSPIAPRSLVVEAQAAWGWTARRDRR